MMAIFAQRLEKVKLAGSAGPGRVGHRRPWKGRSTPNALVQANLPKALPRAVQVADRWQLGQSAAKTSQADIACALLRGNSRAVWSLGKNGTRGGRRPRSLLPLECLDRFRGKMTGRLCKIAPLRAHLSIHVHRINELHEINDNGG
jgi:hypothetical protein